MSWKDDFDFNIVKLEDEVEPESSGSFPDWGLLKLASMRNIQFQSGAELVFDDIFIDGQPFTRKGLTDGDIKSYWFTLDTTNQQGEPYTRTDMFLSKRSYFIENTSIVKEEDKDADKIAIQKRYPPVKVASYEELQKRLPHIWVTDKERERFENGSGVLYISNWGNLQLPVIKKVLGAQANELKEDGLWVKAERTTIRVRPRFKDGEAVMKDDGSGQVKDYDWYWSGFTVYPSKEAMEAAKKAEGNGAAPANPYPAKWGDEVDTYLGLAPGFKEKHGLLEAAKKILLVGSNNATVLRDNEQPVSLETVAKVFNVTVEEVAEAGISDAPF